MSKTSVQIWNFGDVQKVEIHKNGTINKNAKAAFKRGQCHALAIAINKITKWPIIGLCDWMNHRLSPGHVVIKDPRNGGYFDIDGYGAVKRWKKKYGPLTLNEITPNEARYSLDDYLKPHIRAATPIAKTLLKNIGYKFKHSSAKIVKASR